MKKFLRIKDSAKLIYFKNRQVRTPVTLEVTDNDLKKLHIALRMADIQEFEIITVDENKKDEQVIVPIKENKNVIIEDLDIEETFVLEELEGKVKPLTLLEKLMRNEEK